MSEWVTRDDGEWAVREEPEQEESSPPADAGGETADIDGDAAPDADDSGGEDAGVDAVDQLPVRS